MPVKCKDCGTLCRKWYAKQIELMEQDRTMPPMHCLIVALMQSVSVIKDNLGYSTARLLAQQIAAQVEIGLDMALNSEEEVNLDGE